MAGGITGALDGSALGDHALGSNFFRKAIGVVAAPFTGGASLVLLKNKNAASNYVDNKVLTQGVANVAIPVAATVGAVILTVATAGAAAPLIGVAAGGIAAGVAKNTKNQAETAAANQQAQATAQQQQAAQVYAAAHPVLAQVEEWWQEYPTAIMAGAGLLAVALIIRATKG